MIKLFLAAIFRKRYPERIVYYGKEKRKCVTDEDKSLNTIVPECQIN